MIGLMNDFRYKRIEEIDKDLKLPLSDRTRTDLEEEKKQLLEMCKKSNMVF